MAKFKRKFSKKKRTFKKRRFVRRRQPLPKYDGMVRVKMQASKEIIVRTLPGSGIANFLVSWGQQITAPGVDSMVIRDCAEWVRYKNLYRYFCVAGVRTEYKPYGFNAGSTDIISEELLVGSSPTGVAITTATIPLAVDFKVRRSN